MTPLPRTARIVHASLFRLVALVVLALQGAVAVSPVFERHSTARVGAHAEQDGTRHVNQHDELTCGLCAARAQTAMPLTAPPSLATPQPRIVAAGALWSGRSRDVAPHNLSRAPPLLAA